MKINDKEKRVPYAEIRVGECFMYNDNNYIYIKSENVDGDIYDVNLETGFITEKLNPLTKVTYLPNAMINMHGGN